MVLGLGLGRGRLESIQANLFFNNMEGAKRSARVIARGKCDVPRETPEGED